MEETKEIFSRNEEIKKVSYSKLSILFSFLTLTSFLYLFNCIPSTIKANEGFPVIPKWIIALMEASCLLGLVFSIIGLVRKERPKWLKIIGLILNFLLFLLIIGIVAFAFIMDKRAGRR